MKILFVCPQNPFWRGTGAHQRSYFLLTAMVSAGYTVDTIFVDQRYVDEDSALLEKVRVLNVFNFRKNKIENLIYKLRYLLGFGVKFKRKELVNSVSKAFSETPYDYIFARYVDVVQEAGLESCPKLLVDVDDSPNEVFKVRAKTTKNKLLKFWYKIASRNACKYMQDNEPKFVMAFYPQKTQCTLPNSRYLPNIPNVKQDSIFTCTEIPKGKYLLYVGVLSWMPNYLGLDYFIKNIWPKVLEIYPDQEFYIVGKGLPSLLREQWKKYKGINLLGFVQDLTEVYHNARLVVAPIYQGGGTNIKVLEALSYGKALVMSKHASRGFEELIRSYNAAYIAEDNDEFANQIINLISSDMLCLDLQKQGPLMVERHFSFENFKTLLIDSIFSYGKK